MYPGDSFFVVLAPRYYCGIVYYRVCVILQHSPSFLPPPFLIVMSFQRQGHRPGFDVDLVPVALFDKSSLCKLFRWLILSDRGNVPEILLVVEFSRHHLYVLLVCQFEGLCFQQVMINRVYCSGI